MVSATDKKIAGAYAEAIFDTLLKGASIENTKNISETLEMLLKPLMDSESELKSKLMAMYAIARYNLFNNQPVDLDDDVFADYLNWLVEHQND